MTQACEVIERGNPEVWNDIALRYLQGREWQSLLHEKAGLPRMGDEIHQRLLTSLIFRYRVWKLRQSPKFHQDLRAALDPGETHMYRRAKAEAYVLTEKPIPKDLRDYAYPGEMVAQ